MKLYTLQILYATITSTSVLVKVEA